jgi:hypothetical protein
MPGPTAKEGRGDKADKGFAYPLGQKGDLIGTPGAGTHSYSAPPNNWQSDNAVDLAVPVGTAVIAVADGHIGSLIGPLDSNDPRMEGERFYVITSDNEFYYAHLSKILVHPGQSVKKGDICGYSGEANGTAHLHFASKNGNPEQIIEGKVTPGSPSTSIASGEVTGGVDLASVEAAAKAAAFSTFLEFPGAIDIAESLALKGQRSLMNDQQLLPFIEELSKASLRRFQSMPNGNFYAFYPDYFGGMNHRTPYWEIYDIEILDGKMNLTDDALATHVYVVGDTVGFFDGVKVEDKAASAGAVNLFQAMSANFITGLGKDPTPNPNSEKGKKRAKEEALANKESVLRFLEKYGARPYYEEAAMIRSNYYEMFLAFQRFCLLWSKQFTAEFQLTYMPELFPGGLVALPDHGIQLFIEEVSHNLDYENGFTTTAVFTAPVALKGGPEGIHEGMIRANALAPSR